MITVSNAGVHPELTYAAAGLARLGHNVEYFTTMSWASDSAIRHYTKTSLPGSSLLARRLLPSGLRRQQVFRKRTCLEVFRNLAPGRYPSVRQRILQIRDASFERAIATSLGARSPQVLIAQYTNALGAFRASPGSLRILNYPIAHHAWLGTQLHDESVRNPEWAEFLPRESFNADRRRRLDAEIALADVVLVGSTFVKRTFVEAGVPEEKILVIPYGADLSALGADSFAQTAQPTRPFTVTYFGSLDQRKGISYLLQAFNAAAIPDSRLQLVGKPYGNIRKRIEGRPGVQWMPHMSRSRLGTVLSNSDCFALPSLAEGFSLATIEAMACGVTPVVSPNSFGEDVIEEGKSGFIVDHDDIDLMARRFQELAGNPERRRQMGEMASKRAKHFSWTRYQDQLGAQVVELIGR